MKVFSTFLASLFMLSSFSVLAQDRTFHIGAMYVAPEATKAL